MHHILWFNDGIITFILCYVLLYYFRCCVEIFALLLLLTYLACYWVYVLVNCVHRVLKIELQLRLPQRHCLWSCDDSIADQGSSIFSYFNYWLSMIIIYTACMLNYADKNAFCNFFRLIVPYLDSCCQWSVAVVKAVAELKVNRCWL